MHRVPSVRISRPISRGPIRRFRGGDLIPPGRRGGRGRVEMFDFKSRINLIEDWRMRFIQLFMDRDGYER